MPKKPSIPLMDTDYDKIDYKDFNLRIFGWLILVPSAIILVIFQSQFLAFWYVFVNLMIFLSGNIINICGTFLGFLFLILSYFVIRNFNSE